MLALAISACRTVTYATVCSTAEYGISDQELAGDLPVRTEDVLDVIVGPFSFTGAYEDGTVVTGHGEVVRGAGEAVVIDRTREIHESSTGFGFRRDGRVTQSDVECEDALEIPVDAWLVTDDGALDLAFDGVAVPVSTRVDRRPQFFDVRGAIDPVDAPALPGPPEPDAWLEVRLQWRPTGFHWVSLFWEGGDYVQILEAGPSD